MAGKGMLVLERTKDQVICIGEDIRIMVVAVEGGRVKLGVCAPGLRIDRQEIRERKDSKHDA
jgi:carbon storage regulator CsrA